MSASASPRRLRHPSRVTGLLALLVATLLAATGLTQPSAAEEGAESLPFRDPSLSVDARVDDLLGRLTLAEKIALLHQYQPAIPRLGIAPFRTGTEALHGVAWSTDGDNGGAVVTAEATVFPQAVGLASTWDPDLVRAGRRRGRRRGPRLPRAGPRRVGPQRLGAGGQPAARPALGPQRGGLLRGRAGSPARWPPRTRAACAATTRPT